MKHLIFSYGTLQKYKVQKELFGRVLEGRSDAILGYKLSKIEIKDKSVLEQSEDKYHPIAILTRNDNDSVAGKVFEITKEELLKIDSYEVENYLRITEVLESGKKAWLYVDKINYSKRKYPDYINYKNRGIKPSVLSQEFPIPSLHSSKKFFPDNPYLSDVFLSEKEKQKFRAYLFCAFLRDTIEVEHSLVIPAIAAIERIPYYIPSDAKQDLFKIATDEGFHAEQSLLYLTKLEQHFNIKRPLNSLPPLFIKRLEAQKNNEEDSTIRDLITILNGIVTETRISIELGQFASNRELDSTVRDICRTHSIDEAIHSSQFQALGTWLWEEFNNSLKIKIANLFSKSIINRNLPDINVLIKAISHAKDFSLHEATEVVVNRYKADILIHEMLKTAKPTLTFMSKLGVQNYWSFDLEIKKEREQLEMKLVNLVKK